jgi:hypothetical protein
VDSNHEHLIRSEKLYPFNYQSISCSNLQVYS